MPVAAHDQEVGAELLRLRPDFFRNGRPLAIHRDRIDRRAMSGESARDLVAGVNCRG